MNLRWPRTLRGQLGCAALIVLVPLIVASAVQIAVLTDRATIDQTLLFVGLQVAVAAAMTTLAIVLIARWVARPLVALRDSARAYERGTQAPLVVPEPLSPVEVAEVVGAYNAMAAKIAEESRRLLNEALYDELTGLPNRNLFQDHAERALARARRTGRRVAIIYFDVDDFKLVNDSFGRSAGDELLTQVGHRLAETVRSGESGARIGGDEFAVTAELSRDPAKAADAATALAERVLEGLSRPFEVCEQEVRLGASAGIVLAEGHETVSDLLRNADVAMYRAKEAGRGSFVFFRSQMRDAVEAQLRSASELRHALAERQLTVHYQPIVALTSGEIVAIEALCRWEHPERGLIPPSEFIPTAERTGLIWELGRRILDEACAQGAELTRRHPSLRSVAVNLSARQLHDPRLVSHVASALSASGLEPGALVLEVTESAIVDDFDSASARLEALKELGVGVSIDDFGTGYTSLSYLKSLPIDQLKIAGEFVRDIERSEPDAAMLRAIVEIAQVLGLHTVAEMVETEPTHHRLRALGCTMGQGYLYARPLAVAELEELLAGGEPLVIERGADGTALASSTHPAVASAVREVLGAIPDTVVMAFDCEGRWTLAEGVPMQLTGWRASEFVGRRPDEVLPAQRGAELQGHIDAALEGRRRELTWHSTQGSRTLELTVLPRRNERGEITGALLVGRDAGTDSGAGVLTGSGRSA